MKFNEFLTHCVNDSINSGSEPDRFDLSRLTDAHVRALLDPPGDYTDWDAAADAGLVERVSDQHGEIRRTAKGDRALAEAQRIADGLPGGDSVAVLDALLGLGLVAVVDGPALRATPGGRLVLALRERRETR